MNNKKMVRHLFKDAVFNRDKHKCVLCPYTKDLDAHHITDRNEMPNGGYVVENGITLCPEHHIDAERFHVTGGQDWVEDMHPNDLYRKINSSKFKATEASRHITR